MLIPCSIYIIWFFSVSFKSFVGLSMFWLHFLSYFCYYFIYLLFFFVFFIGFRSYFYVRFITFYVWAGSHIIHSLLFELPLVNIKNNLTWLFLCTCRYKLDFFTFRCYFFVCFVLFHPLDFLNFCIYQSTDNFLNGVSLVRLYTNECNCT